MENNDGPEWLDYKKYVDDIVSQAILSAVGCRFVRQIIKIKKTLSNIDLEAYNFYPSN